MRKGHSFSGRERNCVFLNSGDSKFTDVSGISGIDFPDDARSVARVDWDQDGDIDLWLANRNAPQIRFLRNEIADPKYVLSIRMQGTTSNRDAIGARVTLIGPRWQHAKTVKAGDGYLTQSSKWIHFGDARDAERIRVRWPSGKVEVFELANDLLMTKRLVAVEGSGELQKWIAPLIATSIAGTNAEKVEGEFQVQPVDLASTVSVVELPIPQLPYEPVNQSSAGTKWDILQTKGPMVVSLWASWCEPCISELNQWNEQIGQLESANIQVLAISVDGLDVSTSSQADGVEAAKRYGWSFPVGMATPELVERLQLMHDYLFSLQQPLPIPSTFLLDSNHCILAVYKGPVSVQQIQRDIELEDATHADKRDASVPFSGRWCGKTRTLPLGAFANELLATGAIAETSEYVQRNQSRFRKDSLLELVVKLGVANAGAGNMRLAERHFDMARKILPNTVGPEIELGQFFEGRGDHVRAMEQYRQAIVRNPSSPQALNNLAWLLTTSPDEEIRNGKEALRMAKKASLLTNNRHPGVLDTLAAALAEGQRWDDAIQTGRRAEAIARRVRMFRLANEIAARIRLYELQKPVREEN